MTTQQSLRFWKFQPDVTNQCTFIYTRPASELCAWAESTWPACMMHSVGEATVASKKVLLWCSWSVSLDLKLTEANFLPNSIICYAYESLRCLDLEIWWFLFSQQQQQRHDRLLYPLYMYTAHCSHGDIWLTDGSSGNTERVEICPEPAMDHSSGRPLVKPRCRCGVLTTRIWILG